METTRLYTPAEVADRYKVKLDTVWAWIRKGKLRATRIGGKCYRIREDDLTEFEERTAEVNKRKDGK